MRWASLHGHGVLPSTCSYAKERPSGWPRGAGLAGATMSLELRTKQRPSALTVFSSLSRPPEQLYIRGSGTRGGGSGAEPHQCLEELIGKMVNGIARSTYFRRVLLILGPVSSSEETLLPRTPKIDGDPHYSKPEDPGAGHKYQEVARSQLDKLQEWSLHKDQRCLECP
ncbi:hypothetical protein NDU88_005524 [Pleurodeles waltl]|uniref:Uncharacterized protein n=1 Tax=Pleurodeles waltl TaxID=8319 RepID=A0AAV7L1J3_PLEWA|nr:hypothetical protein NDU88_005524 [Pleurodeles waltl]